MSRGPCPRPRRCAPCAAAFKATLLWVQDPSDQRRRAAHDAAKRIGDRTPAQLVALAAFFSGGSLSPPQYPAVPAPPHATGRLAAGAVLLASEAAPDPKKALRQALAAADLIAAEGVTV